MLRRSLIFSAVGALTITLSLIRTTAQQSNEPPSAAETQGNSSQVTQGGNNQPQPNGTKPDAPAPTQPPPAFPIVETGNNAIPPAQNQNGKLPQFLDKAVSDPVVWLTAVLAVLALWHGCIYRGQLNATKAIERAYVALSHQLPGLEFDDALVTIPGIQGDMQTRAKIVVKNTGHTPATITYFVFHPYFGNLPEHPHYDESEGEVIRAFLTKNDSFMFKKEWRIRYDEDFRKMNQNMYVIGYVDYIDRFGVRHRNGYARRYNLRVDDPALWTKNDGTKDIRAERMRNNLEFVITANYNYDRERNKGEGNDWNEKA